MRDGFNREINYLRVSVTDKCNLRCRYCMPEDGIEKINHENILTIDEYLKIGKIFKDLGVKKIRITGGEPLVRKGIIDLVRGYKDLGFEEIAMTTNGVLLGDMLEDLKEAGLTRVNISLDTLDSEKYSHITRGGDIEKVFKSIEKCEELGIKPVKLNSVLIKGFNDNEFKDFVNLTKDRDMDVRFIELMPIGEGRKFKENYVSNEVLIKSMPELQAIKSKDKSSPANYYKLPEGKGRVGFINPISCKFCENCNRVRLNQKGQLIMCLHSEKYIDLLPTLRDGGNIENIIVDAIMNKPESHHILEGSYNSNNMNTIGG